MNDSSVLATRLVPPRLGPRMLRRDRLVRRIVEGRTGRLTLITAGAGFGKTTLVADAVAAMEGSVAWLSCDAGTNTPASLGRHLVAAIARVVPGFGAAVGIPNSPEDVVAAVVNEFVAVGPDRMVLVLDDVHNLTGAAGRVPADLAAHLPDGIHLVLASRENPSFSVARLRLSGVCEIGERELALTEDEVAELFRLQGQDVTRAPEAHRRTEGWPAAVTLIGRPGHSGSDGDVATPVPLMEYLADEVIDVVGADGHRLLDATALCGRVTPRMAARALDDPAAGEVLGRLAEASFLVAPLEGEGEWFRYHALLREFLRARADALDADARRDLHLRTADAWLVEDEIREAVPHLLAAGAHDRAAGLIAGVADAMAGSDQAPVLARWLEDLPPDVVDANPALIAASGYLLFGQRRYEAAFDRLFLAVGRMAAAGAPEAAAATLFRLLEVLETAGEFTRAVGVCEAVLPSMEAGDGLLASALQLRLAVFLGNLGRFEEAGAILCAIETSPLADAAPVLRTYAQFVRSWAIDHPQGRSREALASITRVAERFEGDPEGDVLRLLPWVYALRALIHNTLLEDEGMAVDIARFAELAPRYGVDAAAGPIVIRARMLQMMREGRLDDLDDEVARWDEHFVAWKDINWNYHYFPLAATAHLLRGRLPQAVVSLRHFRDTLRERAPLIEQARLSPDGALLALRAGDVSLAKEMVTLGLDAAERTGAPWALVHANAVGAVVWHGHADGVRMLVRALEEARGEGAVDAWTRIDRPIAAQLLATAMREGLGPEDVVLQMTAACGGEVVTAIAELLADGPARARVMLAQAVADSGVGADVIEGFLRDRDPRVRETARTGWNRRLRGARARVDIVSFGPLVVLRDGRRVDPRVFSRQKSRGLLAALVAAGGSVDRDRLCEWLWPDLVPERASAALRTTLHDLRRGVEPEVMVGSPHALVRSDGDRIHLALAAGDTWDLAVFRAHLADARSAEDPAARIGALTRAERLAMSPFLTEWDLEDWTRDARNEVEREVNGLRAELADAFLSSGRPEESIPRLRALCEAEPEREEWHRRLMRGYADAGERALALRQFHVFRALLRRGQGIEPAEETRLLYRDILAS